MEFDRLAVPDLTKHLREQDKKRYADPDAPPSDLPRVWCAYRWNSAKRIWLLLGFVRYPRISMSRMLRIRRRFQLGARDHLLAIELFDAQRNGPPTDPPRDLSKTSSWRGLPPLPAEQHNTRRVRRVAEPDVKTVKYIVIGDFPRRAKGSVYLGVLSAQTLADAKREVTTLFRGVYAECHVIDLKTAKKSIRRRLRKGRLIPAVTPLSLGGVK